MKTRNNLAGGYQWLLWQLLHAVQLLCREGGGHRAGNQAATTTRPTKHLAEPHSANWYLLGHAKFVASVYYNLVGTFVVKLSSANVYASLTEVKWSTPHKTLSQELGMNRVMFVVSRTSIVCTIKCAIPSPQCVNSHNYMLLDLEGVICKTKLMAQRWTVLFSPRPRSTVLRLSGCWGGGLYVLSTNVNL